MRQQERAMAYRCGRYVVDPAQRRLQCDGTDVALEAKVFDLILLLLEHRERALGKQEVVQALWGNRPISDAALSQLVYKARRALDDGSPRRDGVIRTVYGRGLQWVAAVEPILPAADTPATAHPELAAPDRPPPGTRRIGPVSRVAVAMVLAVGVALLALWLIPASKAPPAPEPPSLAVLPTTNATTDPALDWAGHGLPGLMASLLAEGPGLNVIDPLKVARAWDYTPPPGRSHAVHARFVTHADIVVSSRLRKLADKLYELQLRVEPDTGAATELVLTGSHPGTLAINAVARIRHALALQPANPAVPDAQPTDAYLAETFARGLDEAMRGRWLQAKAYFRLCVQNAPGFLPARFRLGQAQATTDEPVEGEKTLQAVLAEAHARGDDALAAASLTQLAALAIARHRHSDALVLLHRAAPLAARASDPALQAAIALKTVNAAARLHRVALARQQLDLARRLLDQHQLRQLATDLHNSEGFLAEATGDSAAAEAANRAALAASEAIGNERDAMGDAYNLALVLARQGKNREAMRLFAHTYRRARDADPWLAFASGDNLAIAMLNAGLTHPVAPIATELLATGKRQHNSVWQSLAWMLRAGQAWYEGDATASLAHCRAAAALVDPVQDPALLLAIRLSEASAALLAEPGALAALAHDADALIDTQKQPADFTYERQLIHAMAASAAHHPAQARAALEAAAAASHASDPTVDNLHYIGLTIALRDHDPDAARIALGGFDPAKSASADVLRLYRLWARQQGDRAAQAQADARLATLHSDALAALAAEPIDQGPASP